MLEELPGVPIVISVGLVVPLVANQFGAGRRRSRMRGKLQKWMPMSEKSLVFGSLEKVQRLRKEGFAAGVEFSWGASQSNEKRCYSRVYVAA